MVIEDIDLKQRAKYIGSTQGTEHLYRNNREPKQKHKLHRRAEKKLILSLTAIAQESTTLLAPINMEKREIPSV